MTKLWLALAIIWGILVHGTCLFLIHELNTKEQHFNHKQWGTVNVPIEDSTHLVMSDTEAEEYIAIDLEEDIIYTDPTTQAKTTEQIEQEADYLLRDIKNYNEKIKSKTAIIEGLTKQVKSSIAGFGKKDLTASQEILNLANKTKGQADKDMNELKQTINNAKQKQQVLSKTNVTEKIKEADAIIQEYEKAQKNAQDHITQITQDIRTIQTHIDNFKKEENRQKDNGIKVKQPKQEGESIWKEPYTYTLHTGMQRQITELFNNLPDDYYFYEWTSSDESIAIITRNIDKRTKAVKGLKEGIVTITGKPKNKKNTNIYSITLQIRP